MKRKAYGLGLHGPPFPLRKQRRSSRSKKAKQRISSRSKKAKQSIGLLARPPEKILNSRIAFGKVASVSDEAARNGKHKPRPPYDPFPVRGSQASLRGRPKNMVKMGPGDPPLGAPRPRDRPARLACMHTYVFIKAICLYLRLCSAQGRAQDFPTAG